MLLRRLLGTGSIPAYAGEPAAPDGYWRQLEVYPRVCGGTPLNNRRPGYCLGLSPRMRGNRFHPAGQYPAAGSIPAYAGEPDLWPFGVFRVEVYPRVCGGT